MYPWIKRIGVAALVLSRGTVYAQEPPIAAPPLGLPAPAEQDAKKIVEMLAVQLKEQLAQTLPPQFVFEKENNWGHQAQISSIQGFTPIYVTRNHGNWQK